MYIGDSTTNPHANAANARSQPGSIHHRTCAHFALPKPIVTDMAIIYQSMWGIESIFCRWMRKRVHCSYRRCGVPVPINIGRNSRPVRSIARAHQYHKPPSICILFTMHYVCLSSGWTSLKVQNKAKSLWRYLCYRFNRKPPGFKRTGFGWPFWCVLWESRTDMDMTGTKKCPQFYWCDKHRHIEGMFIVC